MNLIDAGPLVALNDQADPYYGRCQSTLPGIHPLNFSTTWPCIAEAMHLLRRAGGFQRQRALWQMTRDGLVDVVDLSSQEVSGVEALMERYQDSPMDLADATLVALADFRGWKKIFTLDTHFFAYRLRDGSALDVILPKKETT